MNIQNGLQVLVIAGVAILALILSMTVLSVTDHVIPPAFPETLIALVGGLIGAGAVHLSAKVNSSSGSGPPTS